MSAIAPPPWALSDKTTNITREILAADGSVVCSVWNIRHAMLPSNEATTRLILAAPELLCALELASKMLRTLNAESDVVDKALVAARGEQ